MANDDISNQMFRTLFLLIVCGFVLTLYYLVNIGRIEHQGVRYLAPQYIETYRRCE